MKIVISGQTPSKKNNRKPYVRNGRIMNFPNPKYVKWEKEALQELALLYSNAQFTEKVSIAYSFYVDSNRRRDLDNMIASVNDCLVKAGIISDDSWQTLDIGGASAEIDSRRPRAEIIIFND